MPSSRTPESSSKPVPTQPSVAVLGLGAMGSRMARRLLDAGFAVTVWNRSSKAVEPLVASGARQADSPRAAAEGAGVVLSMLTDDTVTRTVWLGENGALEGLGPGAVAIEASTVTPGWIGELRHSVETAAAHLVEAPVVGSRPQAEAGQLIGLVAGDPRAIETASPVLDAYCGRVVVVGELGQAAVAKLAINTFFATQIAAVGEAVNLLRGAGIDDPSWLELLTGLPVVAPAIAGAIQAMAAGRFAPQFPIALVEKDLRYTLATADRLGTGHPLASAVQGLFERAVSAGDGGANITGILRQLERETEAREVVA